MSSRSRGSGACSPEVAEEVGVPVLPETAAEQLLVDGRRASSGCGRATRGAAGTARSSANFEPGSEIRAKVTILAEGTPAT